MSGAFAFDGAAYLRAALAADGEARCLELQRELHAAGFGVPALRRMLGQMPRSVLGVLLGSGDLAVTRVAIGREGSRFEPDGDAPRLLIGVREQGVLIDIAAVHTEQGDEWALRTGEAWCLGYDAWLACETGRAAMLRVHSGPMGWLGSGCEGICVLDWQVGASMLRGLGERVQLRCDRGVGEALRGQLSFGGLPSVRETAPVRRAA